MFVSTDCVEDYFKVVMAGLGGSSHMIGATLLALTKLTREYKGKRFFQMIIRFF